MTKKTCKELEELERVSKVWKDNGHKSGTDVEKALAQARQQGREEGAKVTAKVMVKNAEWHAKMRDEIRALERASFKAECVKVITSLKSPYPLDLMPSKLLPTKQEKKAWKFGDLVFNNTKNDILDIIKELK